MFKKVWLGWTIGVSVVFVPVFILVSLVQPDAPKSMLFAIPILPLIAAFQGVLIGGLVCLGLKVQSKFKRS